MTGEFEPSKKKIQETMEETLVELNHRFDRLFDNGLNDDRKVKKQRWKKSQHVFRDYYLQHTLTANYLHNLHCCSNKKYSQLCFPQKLQAQFFRKENQTGCFNFCRSSKNENVSAVDYNNKNLPVSNLADEGVLTAAKKCLTDWTAPNHFITYEKPYQCQWKLNGSGRFYQLKHFLPNSSAGTKALRFCFFHFYKMR